MEGGRRWCTELTDGVTKSSGNNIFSSRENQLETWHLLTQPRVNFLRPDSVLQTGLEVLWRALDTVPTYCTKLFLTSLTSDALYATDKPFYDNNITGFSKS